MADIHDAAKRRILDTFPAASDPVSQFHKYEEDFYLDTLKVLADRIPFRKTSDNLSLTLFLYAGCLKFDRWFAPSPFVVDPLQREHFSQFVKALAKCEVADNTATFELHELRDACYAELDGRPMREISPERIAFLRDGARAIARPSHPTKVAEFDQELVTIEAILDGLQDGSLCTMLTTRLPFILNRTPLSLSFTWKGAPGKLLAEPSFSPSAESDLITAPAAVAIGASRWQSGSSRIQIALEAFYDGDAYAEPLQALPGHDAPFTGWPKGVALAFAIIHDVSWRLRLDDLGEMPWIPAPRDLGDIEVSFRTSRCEQLAFKKKSSPANHIRVFSPTSEVVELSLGEIETPPWSTKCRSQAVTYMQLGELNEALFWLNVATEALFRERFAVISASSGRKELEAQLNSPKAFWGPAEEIVVAQFPELAGKIRWPDTEIHVSIYAKLKFLHKAVPMKVGVEEVLSRYRAVSRYRNDLFHGTTSARVPVVDVQQALEGLDWLDANFLPADS